MLIEAFVIGGALYAGIKAYRRQSVVAKIARPRRWLGHRQGRLTPLLEQPSSTPEIDQANQALAVSSMSLGLTTASIVFAQPTLGLASLPLTLYVFAPTFQNAWRHALKERRVTSAVLDATRIVVCVVMRYDAVAALNAFLQSASQKLFAQAEADFQRQLFDLFGQDQAAVWAYAQGAEFQIAPEQLAIGDVLALSPGDIVPADGVVLYGAGWLDQRLVTGDDSPIPKSIGERVLADSTLLAGKLYVQVEQIFSSVTSGSIRMTLQQTATRTSWAQELGEVSGQRMAPRMLLAFAISLPLLGANRAAAFLTTSFGAQMRTLGPHGVRNFVIAAARQGILIKDVRALEKAVVVNTLILDARLFNDPQVRTQAKTLIHNLRRRAWHIHRLRPHRFAIYLLANHDEDELARALATELGLDDYFAVPSLDERAMLIERLQKGGRLICYVGAGSDDDPVMAKAFVSIAHRGLGTLTTDAAQVTLLDKDLDRLESFFALANDFMHKQGFNLLAPIGLDVVDIATTLFFHLGVVYSVLFNYTGLLLSAGQAHPLEQRQQQPSPPKQPYAAEHVVALPLAPAT